MADQKPTAKEQIESLKQRINEERLEDKEFQARYLSFVNKLHSYSPMNRLMILAQKPDATACASFTTWKSLGRKPKKGTGLVIFSPAPITRKKYDADGEPILDENGDPKTYTFMSYSSRYRTFDVSDTEGDDLPVLAQMPNVPAEEFLQMAIDVLARVAVENVRPQDVTPQQFALNISRQARTGNGDADRAMRALEYAARLLMETNGITDVSPENWWAARGAAYAIAARWGLDAAAYTINMLPEPLGVMDMSQALIQSVTLAEQIEAIQAGAPMGWVHSWGK